jgi:hypothetical protein
MKGARLVINFCEENGYLFENLPLSLKQLSLSDIIDSFYQEAHWIIEVLEYFPHEKRLFCKVLQYNFGSTQIPKQQLLLKNELSQVQHISFLSLNTTGVYKTRGRKIIPLKVEPKVEPVAVNTREVYKSNFEVSIKDLTFKLGGVSFKKSFSFWAEPIEIFIPNYEIKEEFDAIKNYFVNVLKTKKIQVKLKVEVEGQEIKCIEAKSPEIEKINPELIESVKFEFVKSFTKKKLKVEIDKSLFTMDEYFDNLTDEKIKSNTFYQNDQAFFEDLLHIKDTKHYKNLRYLSEKHAHHILKLRFILKPFSFIFLIEGEKKYHIVWETLDTEEATYIWHCDKEIGVLKRALAKVEDIINLVKIQGKIAYITSSDDDYNRIYHDYSNLTEGFIKWKSELEQIIY